MDWRVWGCFHSPTTTMHLNDIACFGTGWVNFRWGGGFRIAGCYQIKDGESYHSGSSYEDSEGWRNHQAWNCHISRILYDDSNQLLDRGTHVISIPYEQPSTRSEMRYDDAFSRQYIRPDTTIPLHVTCILSQRHRCSDSPLLQYCASRVHERICGWRSLSGQ